MKKKLKLYNVLFPFWMLLLFPQIWLIVLPGNFLIDSLVLLGCMYYLRMQDKKALYKQNIFKIFAFGMLADIIGAIFLLITMFYFEWGQMGDEIYLTAPALLLSTIMIFVLNYFITFKRLEQRVRITLSLVFAIVTAPYTFLVPSSWLYR